MKQGFLLTMHTLQTDQGQDLIYWLHTESGAERLVIRNQQSVCFILQKEVTLAEKVLSGSGFHWKINNLQLKTFEHQSVAALYCLNQKMQRQTVRLLKSYGISAWEDDIQPTERYLMERNIQAGLSWTETGNPEQPGFRIESNTYNPELRAMSLDIETSAWSPNVTPRLYSISITMKAFSWTGLLTDVQNELPQNLDKVFVTGSVKTLLTEFLRQVQQQDPDLFIGWNLINFDFRVLQFWFDQIGIPFAVGRFQSCPVWRQPDPDKDKWLLSLEGRVVIDGIDALRTSFNFFEDYSLNAVSAALLGKQKLISDSQDKVVEIDAMYKNDPYALVAYNLQDCRLVEAIFEKLDLYTFLVERAYLTGLPLNRMGGSAAAFNNLYLPRLHRKGFVAPNLGSQVLEFSSPGGYVFDSLPGLYDQILVLDFKSLYPSIILTFMIDPLGLVLALHDPQSNNVQGFDGGTFNRQLHILPGLIQRLWQQRDEAKRLNNGSLSQAIKILMNSFYGVLGSNLCRFYDPRLSSSITRRGHQIMKDSKDWIEQQGYSVIYGDTDSLFIHVQDPMQKDELTKLGNRLEQKLNNWWREKIEQEYNLTSFLEVEFETCYQRFLMPTIRNMEQGSKKRYAGMISNEGHNELVFKGLEFVRSDWTALAKVFQKELYRRVFEFESFRQWIIDFVASVRSGEKDDLLVFKRRVKKDPKDYASGLPQPAQAALQLQQKYPGRHFSRVEYVITVNGVEALELKQSTLDYDFYVTRQLKPVADAILAFTDEDFDSLISQQLNLL